jgi:hypothetical protein
MHIMGMSAHLIMVLCDLMLERRTLLLLLLQLVPTQVGQDFHVHCSPVPIDRVRGSPIPP